MRLNSSIPPAKLNWFTLVQESDLACAFRSVVAEARRIIMSDSHDTLTVGQPLPVNPEAQRAAMAAIAQVLEFCVR